MVFIFDLTRSRKGAGTGGAKGASAPFAFLLRVQGVQGAKCLFCVHSRVQYALCLQFSEILNRMSKKFLPAARNIFPFRNLSRILQTKTVIRKKKIIFSLLCLNFTNIIR